MYTLSRLCIWIFSFKVINQTMTLKTQKNFKNFNLLFVFKKKKKEITLKYLEIEQKFKYLKCSDLFILQKRFPSEIVFKIRKNAENEKFYFFEEIFRLEKKIAPCVIHCTYTRTSIKISIFRFRYIFLYVRIILWVSIYMCVCVFFSLSLPFFFFFYECKQNTGMYIKNPWKFGRTAVQVKRNTAPIMYSDP